MKVLLFAGTSEGRELANYLNDRGFKFSVCVATEYAKEYLTNAVEVFTGRKGYAEIVKLISSGGYDLVLDATHPYAEVVTHNVKSACEDLSVEYLRTVRATQPLDDHCISVESIQQAVEYLKSTEGNVLLTTGVKNLKDFTELPNYQSRVFARVLNRPQSIEECHNLGYTQTILTDGASTLHDNLSHIELSHAKYLVTKESGAVGGFSEKLEACKLSDVVPIVVTRPKDVDGLTYDETIQRLESVCNNPVWQNQTAERCGHRSVQYDDKILTKHMGSSIRVYGTMPTSLRHALAWDNQFSKTQKEVQIVGIGMGNVRELSPIEVEAIRDSEAVVGASRMVESVSSLIEGKAVHIAYDPVEISHYVDSTPYRSYCVLMSGDTGFFSGTEKLLPKLEGHNVVVHSGISCVSYLSAKVGKPWNGSKILSVHGRTCNYVSAVDRNARTYLLTGGNVGEVCRTLETYNLNYVDIVVGENLSRDDEKLHFGKPKDFIDREFSTLSVMYIENLHAKDVTAIGIPDGEFLRGSVPMTKSEVRAVSVSKCRVAHDSTCWDIGAGTGSVSVELALLSPDGTVYAVEKNPEGVKLIRENAKRFRASNVTTIEGNAETIVETLPPPDVVFIGGSGGKLSSILNVALEKNPKARVVVNCITLETLTLAVDFADSHALPCEVTQVSVTRTQKVSRYHMFKAENPVYIVVVN